MDIYVIMLCNLTFHKHQTTKLSRPEDGLPESVCTHNLLVNIIMHAPMLPESVCTHNLCVHIIC